MLNTFDTYHYHWHWHRLLLLLWHWLWLWYWYWYWYWLGVGVGTGTCTDISIGTGSIIIIVIIIKLNPLMTPGPGFKCGLHWCSYYCATPAPLDNTFLLIQAEFSFLSLSVHHSCPVKVWGASLVTSCKM